MPREDYVKFEETHAVNSNIYLAGLIIFFCTFYVFGVYFLLKFLYVLGIPSMYIYVYISLITIGVIFMLFGVVIAQKKKASYCGQVHQIIKEGYHEMEEQDE